MYYFFKKCPIYNKKTGKEILIPKENGYRYKHAFVNGHVITYDAMSDQRFSTYTRNMKYLGCGEILYQHNRMVPDCKEEQIYAILLLASRKYGIINIRMAEILQDMKSSNKIEGYAINAYDQIIVYNHEWGNFIIED